MFFHKPSNLPRISIQIWFTLTNLRYVLLSCCSRAERAVAWKQAEAYNRTVNTVPPALFFHARQYEHALGQDDNIGLAHGYVMALLLLSGTCVFSLSFPLVSPIFLLYLLIKHSVDIQNLRLFYTAREHQPMLLRTAVQVAMVSPVLAQVTIAMFHIAYDVYAWSQANQAGEKYKGDSSASLWSGGLLIVNSTMLLMAQVAFTTS